MTELEKEIIKLQLEKELNKLKEEIAELKRNLNTSTNLEDAITYKVVDRSFDFMRKWSVIITRFITLLIGLLSLFGYKKLRIL